MESSAQDNATNENYMPRMKKLNLESGVQIELFRFTRLAPILCTLSYSRWGDLCFGISEPVCAQSNSRLTNLWANKMQRVRLQWRRSSRYARVAESGQREERQSAGASSLSGADSQHANQQTPICLRVHTFKGVCKCMNVQAYHLLMSKLGAQKIMISTDVFFLHSRYLRS
jgi:hypothetical protein